MKKALSLLIASIAISTTAQASIVINTFAGELRTQSGTILPNGALLQLVNLGADGVFNPIDVTDGTTGALTQWVSGDDSLVNLPFGAIDFASAAAFDLNAGAEGTAGPGTTDRVFVFATNAVPGGTKLGLRWWSGFQATSFGSITLAGGERYGQFTRQSASQHGGDLWIAPNDGANVSFDAFASASIGGADSDISARSSFVVVPEPASMALSLIGAAGLAFMRRRRA